jgi:hypothetical protein
MQLDCFRCPPDGSRFPSVEDVPYCSKLLRSTIWRRACAAVGEGAVRISHFTRPNRGPRLGVNVNARLDAGLVSFIGKLRSATSRFEGGCVLALVGALLFPTGAASQTLSATLTDPAAKGKEDEQVRGTATFTLDAPKGTIEFSIFVRPPAIATEQVSVHLGTPSDPGPTIFILAEGESQNPIQGAIHRGAEIAQPEDGIEDWDDALRAMSQDKTFLKIASRSDPVAGLVGVIRRP